MSETDQKIRSRSQHPLERVLPLAGGVLGAMAFAITVIPIDLPWASSNAGTPTVVTFDTAKYVNARRAVASELLGDAETRDSAVSTFARVDNGVRPAILEAANGAMVIVRQASVLDGTIPDITDTVLDGLGLPTDAPTIETSLDLQGDTTYSASSLYEEARELVSRANQQARERSASQSEAGIEELLP
ncbi:MULTISPECIES: hypothetical protein [Vreelandella]|uniref:Uncharacterized protein n=1 Tax=Vreelandella titanicae TaxID=664683 RepID=A0A558J108_9GAMM|nr:hypothetical protein [Halomonas titanicae]TVU87341.1 hypothetical protein FQP89_22445 [Halomonas titanicae]